MKRMLAVSLFTLAAAGQLANPVAMQAQNSNTETSSERVLVTVPNSTTALSPRHCVGCEIVPPPGTPHVSL